MTTLSLTILIITSIFFTAGLIATFLPIIPGTFLVWIGILIHKVALGDDSVSWTFFAVATAHTILAQVLDYLCSFWGAKRFGAAGKADSG